MKLVFDDFIGKPCVSTDSFEFVPKKRNSLHLLAIGEKLEDKRVFVEIKNEFFLSIKFEKTKISIFKSGKILVRAADSMEQAKKIVQKLIELMN
jgi:TATA-box binding protein (TBP) (component of TFIID and TFIIIB)